MAKRGQKKPVTDLTSVAGKPLDPDASDTLQNAVSELRDALLREAAKISKEDQVTEIDLFQALNRLTQPTRGQIELADAQSVVSQALAENRRWEIVFGGMAVSLFGLGVGLVIGGALSDDVNARLGLMAGGVVIETLLILPIRFIANSRKHNMALRMLAHVMDQVDDPKKLAPLLKDTFLAVVLGKKLPE